ncbi:ENTH domain-containing protein 1 [Terrapene carolina triunguis]|uniref:ENTH domain-containing protein 1 n=1 Tax=Terrapene triunguis TaxID=2587831 RepID=UPI000E77771D|nr:ENTH domain-containing protein 1 [Terrapene carolina triunguis]
MALRRHMKNFVKNYSDSEIKVREATSNDPWGPSSSLMLEISDLTYNTVSLLEIMNMIWHRMNDQGKNWRHVYKSLTLLDYLIKNGSKKVIQHCREGLFNIQTLKDFHYIDEAGKNQGYHVREKSKQVSALLTDDQLLHNEREIARRTRQRTSYAMLLPKKTTTKDCLPTMSASEPIPELPDSVKLQHHFPKVASAPQQNQPFQSPGKAAMAQEMVASQITAKKSSEDLIVFSEDEQTPATTTLPPPFPAEGSSDGAPPVVQAAASDSWNRSMMAKQFKTFCLTGVISFSSQRSLSTSQKWGTGRRTYSTVTNPASTITLMPPSRNQSANTPKIAEMLLGRQSSVPEKPATTSQHVPESDFLPSSSKASVETLYLSPTFNVFDPLGNSVANSEILKPTPSSSKQFPGPNTTTMLNFNSSTPNSVQTFNTNLHLSPRPDSTSSMATTSSFSTFSISSPDSVVPENIVHPNLIPSCGPSGLSSPHKLSSSVFFNCLKDRVTHPFSCQRSEEEESENTSILNLLPDNSRHCAGKVNSFESRTLRISGGSWGAFPVQNVDPVGSPNMPSAGGSPNVGMTKKALGTLEEIKNAVLGLRGDIGKVAQELQNIGSQMASLVGDIQHMSKFSTASQTAKDAPCQ